MFFLFTFETDSFFLKGKEEKERKEEKESDRKEERERKFVSIRKSEVNDTLHSLTLMRRRESLSSFFLFLLSSI